jgi:hypothetical protein
VAAASDESSSEMPISENGTHQPIIQHGFAISALTMR